MIIGVYGFLSNVSKSSVNVLVQVGLFQSDQDNRHSSKKSNKYQLLYTYGCTS